jgi:hypothetical protein
MSQRLKRNLLLLILGFIISCGALYILARNTGSLITTAINQFAPTLTGVETHVDRVILNPWSGKGSLRRFFLGNPKGAKTDSAVTVDKIAISVNLKSLASSPIEISEIDVRSPIITWEGTLTQSNLLDIQKNLASSRNSAAGKSTLIKIRSFKITNIKIRLALFGSEPKMISLPDLHLTDLGGSSGISSAQIATQIFSEIISATTQQIFKVPGIIESGSQKLWKGIKSLTGN